MDKSWLPSKKLVLSFGALAIVLLGGFFVSKIGKNNDTYFGDTNLIVSNILRSQILENDTDGDGLMDWEESLWKTDINKSDTDGDGTDDNDEILQKRNPTIAGPDDLLKEEVLNEDDLVKYADEENLTETEKLSRDFLVDYLSMKKSGSLDENKVNLVNYLSQKTFESSGNVINKVYTYSDINIINSNTKSDLEDYKQKFMNIMMFSNKPREDIIIFKDILEKKDQNKVVELNNIISMYEGMFEDLLKMNVPSSLSQGHLIVLNSFEDMIEGTKKMATVLVDPVGGLNGMNLRIAAESNFMDGLNKLNDILEK